MAASAPNKILLSANEQDGGKRPYDEALAGVALTPGEFLAMNSSDKLIPHGTADGVVPLPMVCLQNPYNDGTGAGIDHDYAADETAYYAVPQRGDIANIFIKASAVLSKGVTQLASDGAGALQVIAPDASDLVTSVVAVAWEDVTIGGSRARAKVRFI